MTFILALIIKILGLYEPFDLKYDCSTFSLGAVLLQKHGQDRELHPVSFLYRFFIQAKQNYEIFDTELLAIVSSFEEYRHHLKGNPNRFQLIVKTNYCNPKSFMTAKQLTQ